MNDVTIPHIPFNLKAVHLISGDGTALDIASITLGFTLYESINNKFVTGDITIVDGLNLIKNYRFTGQEHIRLHFDTEPDSVDEKEEPGATKGIDVTFRVYKLENVERPKAIVQTYQMKLCDPYMFNANTTRISKVYRGSYSDMLTKVFDEFGAKGGIESGVIPATIEETKIAKAQFVVPNWRATTFIDWIVKNADNKTGSWRNSMFFYQTFREGFKFKSISNMCGTSTKDETSDIKVLHYPAGAGEVDSYEGGFPKEVQVLQISKPQVFDTLRATVKGAYASRSLTYDPVTKIEAKNRYNILETFERGGSHVSEPAHPLIRTSDSDKEKFVPFTTMDSNHFEGVVEKKDLPHLSSLYPNHQENSFVLYDYNTNHDFDNNKSLGDETWEGHKVRDNSRLERNALLEILKQHKVVVIMPIRTDISVGDVIELKQSEPELADRDTTDLINDNKYLVVDSCITVNLSVPGLYGSLQLELVKESFAQEVNEENVSALLEDDSYEAEK
tara:strand:- start:1713 stop:3221 length:1509 start_codon:yes stop_codon:yes gene_type:complete